MKPFFFRSYVACVAFALAIGSLPCRAAEPASTPPTPLPRVARPGTLTVDVNFSGGTLAQFVAQLRASDGTGFDLLSDTSLSETPVPLTKIHNIDLAALTSALNQLLRAHNLTISAVPGNILVATKATVYTPIPGPTFQAFQLAPYLTTLGIDDITDAITSAWTADPKRDPKALIFKFHPATKVLFVYGPSEGITMAAQIIPQLTPTATAQSTRDFLMSRGMSSVVTSPISPAEQARLDAIADEVRRRRAAREAGSSVAKPSQEK